MRYVYIKFTDVDCETPPSKSNTTVTAPVTTYDNTATYTCVDKYYYTDLSTQRTFTCKNSGQWKDGSVLASSIDGCTGNNSIKKIKIPKVDLPQ